MYEVMMKHAEVMGEIDEALENPNLSKKHRAMLLMNRRLTLEIIAIYLNEIPVRVL